MSEVCTSTGRTPHGAVVPCSGYGRAHTGAHVFEDPAPAALAPVEVAEVEAPRASDPDKRRPMLIRFAQSEREIIDAEAREAGMQTGTWIRATCLRVAKDAQKKRKQEG